MHLSSQPVTAVCVPRRACKEKICAHPARNSHEYDFAKRLLHGLVACCDAHRRPCRMQPPASNRRKPNRQQCLAVCSMRSPMKSSTAPRIPRRRFCIRRQIVTTRPNQTSATPNSASSTTNQHPSTHTSPSCRSRSRRPQSLPMLIILLDKATPWKKTLERFCPTIGLGPFRSSSPPCTSSKTSSVLWVGHYVVHGLDHLANQFIYR